MACACKDHGVIGALYAQIHGGLRFPFPPRIDRPEPYPIREPVKPACARDIGFPRGIVY